MKVAVITDTHWGARNDSQVFTEYFKKFYKEIFFPTLEERGIRTVIHMGDVVDRRKFINWKTVYQMREAFFDACYGRHIELHLIVGNHDTYFRNTNLVNSLQGLRLDNNHQFHIYEKSTEIEIDGIKLFMQPWICDENKEESLKALEKTKAQILFGHLEVKGFEMHLGQYSQSGVDASLFKNLTWLLVVTFTISLTMVTYTILVIHIKLLGLITKIQEGFIYLILKLESWSLS